MKNIKSYKNFINEEVNWRKAVTGIALATSLSLGSCKDIKPGEVIYVYTNKRCYIGSFVSEDNKEVRIKDEDGVYSIPKSKITDIETQSESSHSGDPLPWTPTPYPF